ncbi:MAG: hypothetical protein WC781_00695 [Candidatus Pacearchaeota archaeon]|jgi:hypothetical protein
MKQKKDCYTGAYLGSLDHGLLEFPESFIEAFRLRNPGRNVSFNSFLSNDSIEECLELYDLRALHLLENSYYTKEECENVALSENGRVIIPENAISRLKLDKRGLIVGHKNFVEIWNPEIYSRFVKRLELEEEKDQHNLSNILYSFT